MEEEIAACLEKALKKTDMKFGGVIEVLATKGRDPVTEPKTAMYKALYFTKNEDGEIKGTRLLAHKPVIAR